MPEGAYQNIDWTELIPSWEEIVKEKPNANTGNSFIRELLPFARKIKPRVSTIQSLFGNLTLICLDGVVEKENEVIEEGLRPLIGGGALTSNEADNFRTWFRNPLNRYAKPSKTFSVDGIEYELTVDDYRSYRDLILRIKNAGESRTGYPYYCLTTGCTGLDRDGSCLSTERCTWVQNQPVQK